MTYTPTYHTVAPSTASLSARTTSHRRMPSAATSVAATEPTEREKSCDSDSRKRETHFGGAALEVQFDMVTARSQGDASKRVIGAQQPSRATVHQRAPSRIPGLAHDQDPRRARLDVHG